MAHRTQPFQIIYDGEIIMRGTEANLISYKNRCLNADGFIKEEVEKWIILATKYYKC